MPNRRRYSHARQLRLDDRPEYLVLNLHGSRERPHVRSHYRRIGKCLLFTPTVTGTYTGQAGNVANALTFQQ